MADVATTMVWELPCRSREFQALPTVTQQGSRLKITYDFETESGRYHQACITFEGVVACSFTSFESCSPDQVAAYDRLIAIGESVWLGELRSRRVSIDHSARHYRIFFDDVGCYEVIASEFWPPRHKGP